MSEKKWAEVEFWKEHIKAGKAIAVIWTVDDVLAEAESWEDMDINEEDAKEILANIDKYHDAEQGVCWDVIRAWIDEYILSNKKN